jgi:hypothetical protein
MQLCVWLCTLTGGMLRGVWLCTLTGGLLRGVAGTSPVELQALMEFRNALDNPEVCPSVCQAAPYDRMRRAPTLRLAAHRD